MKAFFIDGYGNRHPGRIGELPEPQVRDDDVLAEVHAAGVNVLDAKIRTVTEAAVTAVQRTPASNQLGIARRPLVRRETGHVPAATRSLGRRAGCSRALSLSRRTALGQAQGQLYTHEQQKG